MERLNGAEPVARYSGIARCLHWVTAAIIIWALLSGGVLGRLPSSPLRDGVAAFNVSLTLLLIPLFALRIGCALLARRPPPLAVPPAHRAAARAGHAVLYMLVLAVLLSGLLMMKTDISFFGIVELPRPLNDAHLNERFARLHIASSLLLAVAVAGHIAMVAFHERHGRPVLARMLGTQAPVRQQSKPLKNGADVRFRAWRRA